MLQGQPAPGEAAVSRRPPRHGARQGHRRGEGIAPLRWWGSAHRPTGSCSPPPAPLPAVGSVPSGCAPEPLRGVGHGVVRGKKLGSRAWRGALWAAQAGQRGASCSVPVSATALTPSIGRRAKAPLGPAGAQARGVSGRGGGEGGAGLGGGGSPVACGAVPPAPGPAVLRQAHVSLVGQGAAAWLDPRGAANQGVESKDAAWKQQGPTKERIRGLVGVGTGVAGGAACHGPSASRSSGQANVQCGSMEPQHGPAACRAEAGERSAPSPLSSARSMSSTYLNSTTGSTGGTGLPAVRELPLCARQRWRALAALRRPAARDRWGKRRAACLRGCGAGQGQPVGRWLGWGRRRALRTNAGDGPDNGGGTAEHDALVDGAVGAHRGAFGEEGGPHIERGGACQEGRAGLCFEGGAWQPWCGAARRSDAGSLRCHAAWLPAWRRQRGRGQSGEGGAAQRAGLTAAHAGCAAADPGRHPASGPRRLSPAAMPCSSSPMSPYTIPRVEKASKKRRRPLALALCRAQREAVGGVGGSLGGSLLPGQGGPYLFPACTRLQLPPATWQPPPGTRATQRPLGRPVGRGQPLKPRKKRYRGFEKRQRSRRGLVGLHAAPWRRRHQETKGFGLTRSRCALTFASKSESLAQILLMVALLGSIGTGVGQAAVSSLARGRLFSACSAG
jgi:hypothetical protein